MRAEDSMPTTLTPGPTVVVAGDIADEHGTAADTAGLLRSVPNATVLAVGDNAYTCGTPDEYAQHYKTTWGDPEILARTRACPGNHEYKCHMQGRGYFEFFKPTHQHLWAAATKDFYSFQIADCR